MLLFLAMEVCFGGDTRDFVEAGLILASPKSVLPPLPLLLCP